MPDASSNTATSGPYVQRSKVTLRVLGTSVTLLENIRQQARSDLGIDITFEVQDGVAAQRLGVLAPHSFDIYDQWFHNVDFVWPANAIQPIQLERIHYWDAINELPKTGRLTPHSPLGAGSNPVDRLYVQPGGSCGSRPSEQITMLPVSHNVDSFGYRLDMLPEGLSADQESWSWLLDERWQGLVSLQNDSAIGAIDAALAAQASGLIQFEDIGNLSVKEIDALIDCLINFKQRRHFRTFWSNQGQSATDMARGKVGIESLWSPAINDLKQRHIEVRLASPQEGYRAWYGGMSISREVRGRTLDAAYEYMNWWLSGWPGAVMARQGYYISTSSLTRPHLSTAEWDYWYAGKPAIEDLCGPMSNDVMIQRGEVRDGGDYFSRMSKIAVWNTVMDEHNYLVRRWNDFMSA
ncbi:ABC transporter substrate-binding protein [Halomonas binhaiensis]|uniref:Extracellular solute-binding protein n=1 Tax=Halomonas binhaiensis TaxID=2562282 RepID=A0A5C1NDG7_9GAMM|nr:extracellular solute-binding protein [Halomonas binhaiensis]QEM81264.1 extracellular solute-binding protein [Halomonas binhaiensis]